MNDLFKLTVLVKLDGLFQPKFNRVLLVYIQVVYLKVKHEILSTNILMQYLNYYYISLITNSFWIWTQTKTQNKNQFGFELRI